MRALGFFSVPCSSGTDKKCSNQSLPPLAKGWEKEQLAGQNPLRHHSSMVANGPRITWAHPHPASPPVRAKVASYGNWRWPRKRLSWTDKRLRCSNVQHAKYDILCTCHVWEIFTSTGQHRVSNLTWVTEPWIRSWEFSLKSYQVYKQSAHLR